MRHRILRRAGAKLRSGGGATIALALLLFLVCAVVGSVVLTAGTAAAGRYSEIASVDARYYAVSSAAELFRDAVDGQTVTVRQVRTETTETTVTGEDDEGKPTTSETTGVAYGSPYFGDGASDGISLTSLPDATDSLLRWAAAWVCFSGGAGTGESAWDYAGTEPWKTGMGVLDSCDFTLSAADENDAPLGVGAVRVRAQLLQNGYIVLRFSDAAGEYIVELTCIADVKSALSEASTHETAEENLTVTDTVYTTRTITFTWSSAGIVKA